MTDRVSQLGTSAGRLSVAPDPREPIDLSQAFRDREILLTGVTGFLGKVALAMLLDRYPDIRRVHVLVRPRAGGTAEDRFFGKVAAAPPFRPLRDKHGAEFERMLREKCAPLAGDVADPSFGLTDAQVTDLSGRLACVINCAGLVTFNPSLELAIAVNTRGARNAAELCKRTGATLVHVSTCFVAGTRRGPVFEDEMLVGSFPKQHSEDGEELPGARFAIDAELADVERQVTQLREQADDHALQAQFARPPSGGSSRRDATSRTRSPSGWPPGVSASSGSRRSSSTREWSARASGAGPTRTRTRRRWASRRSR